MVPRMTTPAAHAFDFIHGRWTVHNRKLRDVTDPACEEWVEFGATSEVFPVLQGVGHIDRMDVADAPDGPPFEGLTLRLFDPSDEMLAHLVELDPRPRVGSTHRSSAASPAARRLRLRRRARPGAR